MIQYRKYVIRECKTCKKELKIRNDYIKIHTGFCRNCRKKKDWENPKYRKYMSESHKGKKSGRALPIGESNFNNLLYTYKKSAEKRGIFFDLTNEQFRKITKQNCHYCGKKPSQIHSAGKKKRFNGYWVHNGIDRIDDGMGYIFSNVVSACKRCNYSKQGMTKSEFLEMIREIYLKHYEQDTVGSRVIGTK